MNVCQFKKKVGLTSSGLGTESCDSNHLAFTLEPGGNLSLPLSRHFDFDADAKQSQMVHPFRS
jgi:hypothetical protein